jgi:hypothetical protein
MTSIEQPGGFLHPRFTRAQLEALGFTREYVRAREAEGWGGPKPKPRWEPGGRRITSPIDLWEVEQARDDVRRARDLGAGGRVRSAAAGH